MKKAYVIISPKSSGNRMMVRAIESTQDFGMGGHTYSSNSSFNYKSKWIDDVDKQDPKILDEALKTAPEEFVYVVSIPSGGLPNKKYLEIAKIILMMMKNGYTVYPIVIHRDIMPMSKSQANAGHAVDVSSAKNTISKAYKHIFSELAMVRRQPIIVKYEQFVTSESYRRWIFCRVLDLPIEPTIEFFNANEKHDTSI